MANIRPQLPDHAESAKQGAAASISVPELRENVVLNSEAIQRLEREVRRLLEIQGRT